MDQLSGFHFLGYLSDGYLSMQVTSHSFPLTTDSEEWTPAAMLVLYLVPPAIVYGTKDKHLPQAEAISWNLE